jgi:hypothetical protein
MAKKKKDDYVSAWSEYIRNMKRQVEHFYLKDDTERKQPYKVSGIRTHFKTGETFVHFYPLRVSDPEDYVLEKDEFLKQFECVVEEI